MDAIDFPMRRTSPFDPPPAYAEARPHGLVKVRMYNGTMAWLATRYDDVREVLASRAFSAMPHRAGYPFPYAALESLLKNERPSFVSMDGAEHSRYRRMFAKAFALSHIEAMRGYIQKVVDETLAELMAKGGSAEFVEDFALVVPSFVISELLGVPYQDHKFFQQAARDRFNVSVGPEVPIEAGKRMGEYLEKLIRSKQASKQPSTDLLSRLINDQINPGHLSIDDAVAAARLILIAGHETTANVIALGTLSLLENPDQLQALKDNPSLIPGAVEEILRYLTIPHFNSIRVAIEDTEVNGQKVKAGEGVLAMIAAANRDPAEFPHPDRFDIKREQNHHITFADGIHQCLGQPLARLELQIVFETVFRKMPNLRVTVPLSDITFKNDGRTYGVLHLPVTW